MRLRRLSRQPRPQKAMPSRCRAPNVLGGGLVRATLGYWVTVEAKCSRRHVERVNPYIWQKKQPKKIKNKVRVAPLI